MVIKKILHLVRYFVFIGIGAFIGYIRDIHDAFLVPMGPSIYLAYYLKKATSLVVGKMTFSQDMDFYIFLLPVSVLYWVIIGFQFKQLINEKGLIRIISLVGLIGFLIYIHFLSYKNLSAFLYSYS